MSLICYECKTDVQPSNQLPGREGSLVYPTVPSLIWTPENSQAPGEVAYVTAQENFCLCFVCIEKSSTVGRDNLQKLYQLYEAETIYSRYKKQELGRLMRVSDIKSYDAYEEYRKLRVEFPKDQCLQCDQGLPEPLKPSFTAVVINRVFSPITSMFGSYSTSVETGMTNFNLCSDCTQENFPRIYSGLSYTLRKKDNPDHTPQKSSLLVDPLLLPKILDLAQKSGIYPISTDSLENN